MVATVILLRHARSTSNDAGVLAGRTPKVGLDDTGVAQVARLVRRLAGVPVAAVVSSPLRRCRQTVAALAADRGLSVVTDRAFTEVDYGEWTGRSLSKLVKEPLWQVVQTHPSAAVFPGGEGLAQVQSRSVAAVRAHCRRVVAEHGPNAVWLMCSHGDVIKAVLADALGVHLDSFQRIVVDPCSVSVIRYTETRPFVLRTNDTGGDLAGIVPSTPSEATSFRRADGSSDAVVGGSLGA